MAEFAGDVKKIHNIIGQLKKIQGEMLDSPESEAEKERDTQLKRLDDWGRAKYDLNLLLKTLREGVKDLESLRAEQKGGQKKSSSYQITG